MKEYFAAHRFSYDMQAVIGKSVADAKRNDFFPEGDADENLDQAIKLIE